METYSDYVFDKLLNRLAALDEQKRADIYVIGLCVSDSGDTWGDQDHEVELQSVIVLGYNTLCNFAEKSSEHDDVLKWHDAYWEECSAIRIPDTPFKGKLNAEEFAMRDAWCMSQGFVATRQDSAGTQQFEWKDLYPATFRLCHDIVRKFHDSGALVDLFTRPLPVLVTNTEGIINMNATEPANPANVFAEVREFLLSAKDGRWLADRPPR